jgi:coenzyme PQQ synthesis protein D (PqqD)
MIAPMVDDVWADDGAEVIAIDEHAALCLAANEIQSPLWRALVDGTTLEQLVASVAELYATSADRLSADVDELLLAFAQRGLH